MDLSRQPDSILTFTIRYRWTKTDLGKAPTHTPKQCARSLPESAPVGTQVNILPSRILNTFGMQRIVMTGTSKEEFEKQTSLIQYILYIFFTFLVYRNNYSLEYRSSRVEKY